MQWLLHYTTRLIVFITALQIMNMGLYCQDVNQARLASRNINYINSVAEYFAETVCKIKDAFPENPKSQGTHPHKHNTPKFPDVKLSIKNDGWQFTTTDLAANYRCDPKQQLYYEFYREINPPPPKA